MLAGPVEYTPGIFDITWRPEQSPHDLFGSANDNTRVHATRAHQSASDVVRARMKPSGGQAIRLVPATDSDLRTVHSYNA